MADSIFAINKPGLALPKYEHLEVLIPIEDKPGERPVRRTQASSRKPNAAKAKSELKLWKTRRRRDGKIFRVAELEDDSPIMDAAKVSLLQLFNHPNIVGLVDVVQHPKPCAKARNYTVWEDCSHGTLNRLLWHEPGKEQIKIPESLCWHVVDGISKALLWLHFGRKRSFPLGQEREHDDDWQPVTMTVIDPTKIFFTAPLGNETYGAVKLGGFQDARVHSSLQSATSVRPTWISGKNPYLPPEVQNHTDGLSPAADIWGLGAVLYHMMTGAPPVPIDLSHATTGSTHHDFWVRKIPEDRYSKGLVQLVRSIMTLGREERVDAWELVEWVGAGLESWREETGEV